MMIPLKKWDVGTRINIIMTVLYVFLVLTAMLLSYDRQRDLITKVVINNARFIAGEALEEMRRSDERSGAGHRISNFQALVDRVSMRDKYYIKILSVDNRREEFRPDVVDEEQLNGLIGTKAPESKRFVEKSGKRLLVYMRPLTMSEPCLRCHGRPEDAPEAIRRRYPPGDVFYNHTVGNFMGAIAVAIPVKEIEDEIWSNLRVDVGYRMILFLLVLLIIKKAITRMVVDPLADLSKQLAHIAAEGDVTERVPVPGEPHVGRVAEAFNNVMDELARRTEQYRESERRYRNTVEMAQTPIITFLDDGTIVVANSAAGKLLREPREDLVGKDFYEFVVDAPLLREKVADYCREISPGSVLRVPVSIRSDREIVEREIALAASDPTKKLFTAVI